MQEIMGANLIEVINKILRLLDSEVTSITNIKKRNIISKKKDLVNIINKLVVILGLLNKLNKEITCTSNSNLINDDQQIIDQYIKNYLNKNYYNLT